MGVDALEQDLALAGIVVELGLACRRTSIELQSRSTRTVSGLPVCRACLRLPVRPWKLNPSCPSFTGLGWPAFCALGPNTSVSEGTDCLLLGTIVEAFGTLNALLPAMFVSVALFLYGTLGTGIWSYRSPQVD